MKGVAQTLRERRKALKLTLQEVSKRTAIDVGILSKIERELRPISEEQLKLLSKIYKLDYSELHKSLIADQVLTYLKQTENPLEILQLAEQKIAYLTKKTKPIAVLIRELSTVLKKFQEVKEAWIFGSYSRGEMTAASDLDIVITANKGFSYFQLADVQYHAEKKIGIKVDIGFKDSLEPNVKKHAERDMKLIYERVKQK